MCLNENVLRIARIGGRIKSAAIGLDLLYPELGIDYAALQKSQADAQQLYKHLKSVRTNPPQELIDAFFPRDFHQMTRGVGFYRPILKMDQGTGGNFLGFSISKDTTLQKKEKIISVEGLAVPEVHYLRSRIGDDTTIHLQRAYAVGDLEASIAILRDIKANGYQRVATVGREPYFFCHPSRAESTPLIGEETVASIEERVHTLLETALRKIKSASRLYLKGHSLQFALAEADLADFEGEMPLIYCQPDIFIDKNGKSTVEKINLPDVMMFLTEISSNANKTFPYIQTIAEQLTDEVVRTLKDVVVEKEVYLLTRTEVLENLEDTLEILEMQALQRKLGSHYSLNVIGPRQVGDLPNGSTVLLFNVNVYDPAYHVLLYRVAKGEISCTPHPFLKAQEKELTELKRVKISGVFKERFLRLIKVGENVTGSSLVAKHRDIEELYHRVGFDNDIAYCYILGERTPVSVIKHSVHSFGSLHNVCQKLGFPDLYFTEIPLTRENARIEGLKYGSRVAAYRFLMRVAT